MKNRERIVEKEKVEKPQPKRKTNKIKEAKEEIARKLADIRKQVEVSRTSVKNIGKKDSEPGGDRVKIVPQSKQKKAVTSPGGRIASVKGPEDGEKVEYKIPSLDLLNSPNRSAHKEGDEHLKLNASVLERTLLEFGVEAKVVKINKGPVITMYELEPSMGTKVKQDHIVK